MVVLVRILLPEFYTITTTAEAHEKSGVKIVSIVGAAYDCRYESGGYYDQYY